MIPTLFPYQKIAVKFAKENKLAFVEAPTGSGKSIITGYLAYEYSKSGKKVIISTSTNQLALELLHTLKEKYNLNEADIVVGKTNYIDIENINLNEISTLIKSDNFITELANLLNKKDNKNEALLLDVFLNKFDIDEATKELLEKMLRSEDTKDYIKDFSDIDISVTNHYYLIFKLLFSKEDFSDYIFILDEAHQISDAMETLFTYTFSLFRFKFLLNKFIDNIKFLEFRGQKSLLKNLLKLQETTITLFNTYTNENLTGLSFTNDEKQIKIIRKIIKYLADTKLYDKIKKITIPNPKIKNLLLEEWGELIEISKLNEKEITIYYSPAKGYPALSAVKGDVYPKLKILWDRMNEVKGFSATLSIPTNERYFQTRLNIQKDVAFFKLSPVFKKSQINYKIVDKNFPAPKTTEDKVDLDWIKAIGDYILNTYENKNSLVLMGGFLEVDNLFQYLSLKTNTPLLKAEKNKSVYSVIENFKKSGGILIATRNYGTGIDLSGKLLEKLYIAKLPYPVIGTKKWLDAIQRDKLRKTSIAHFMMINEMLLNLKQWIGRLIRTPEDKGDLYILDARANKNMIRPKIIKLIEDSFK